MRTRHSKLGDKVLRLALCMLVLYSSYRYPLQINFSGTSPTYSDTPTALQLGKYMIAMALCLLLVLFEKARSVTPDSRLLLIAMSLATIWCMVKTMVSGDSRFLEPVTWFVFASIFFMYANRLHVATIERYLLGLFWISLAVDAVQILLFVTIGRLPALGYEDSISVRFGSFLDDPNGFSGLCFLFIGWAVSVPDHRWSRFVYWASILMILASQSLTSIGFLMLILVYVSVRRLFSSPITSVAVLVVVAIVISTIVDVGRATDIMEQVLENKAGSINAHTRHGLSDLLVGQPWRLLVGSFDYEFYESWWNLAIGNFGLPWATLYLLAAVYTLWQLAVRRSRVRGSQARAVYAALLMFGTFFFFGSFNLPFFIVFPNNLIFYLAAFLVLGNKIDEGTPAGRVLGAARLTRVRLSDAHSLST